MSKHKLLGFSSIALIFVVLMIGIGSVFAGSRASFDNPRLTACSLSGLTVAGTLRIGDTVYVEEYLNGDLNNTFTGSAGAYSGYVAYYDVEAFPYTWKTLLSFKDSNGALIEQYAIEGDCTALNQGSVQFREIKLDIFNMNIG